MSDLDAIRKRDEASAATWFTGPASFTAQAARDRRELLKRVAEMEAPRVDFTEEPPVWTEGPDWSRFDERAPTKDDADEDGDVVWCRVDDTPFFSGWDDPFFRDVSAGYLWWWRRTRPDDFPPVAE